MNTPPTVGPVAQMKGKTILNIAGGDVDLVRNWCKFSDSLAEPAASEIMQKMNADDLITFAAGVRQLKALYDQTTTTAGDGHG